MAGGGASSAWGPSPALVTALVALLGLGLAAYIVGPQLYWHAAEALTAAAACPACDCNCDARPLLDLPEGAPPPPCCLLRSWRCPSFRSDAIGLSFSFPLLLCCCPCLHCVRAVLTQQRVYYRILLPKTFGQWMILRFGGLHYTNGAFFFVSLAKISLLAQISNPFLSPNIQDRTKLRRNNIFF